MGVRESITDSRTLYISSIFLLTMRSTPRDSRGQNECHLSMPVLGNISTSFLELSVDGNISTQATTQFTKGTLYLRVPRI